LVASIDSPDVGVASDADQIEIDTVIGEPEPEQSEALVVDGPCDSRCGVVVADDLSVDHRGILDVLPTGEVRNHDHDRTSAYPLGFDGSG
jgi:hypothetical protein